MTAAVPPESASGLQLALPPTEKTAVQVNSLEDTPFPHTPDEVMMTYNLHMIALFFARPKLIDWLIRVKWV